MRSVPSSAVSKCSERVENVRKIAKISCQSNEEEKHIQVVLDLHGPNFGYKLLRLNKVPTCNNLAQHLYPHPPRYSAQETVLVIKQTEQKSCLLKKASTSSPCTEIYVLDTRNKSLDPIIS